MLVWLSSYPRSGNTLLRTRLKDCFGLHTYSIYDDKFDIGADERVSEFVGHVSHGMEESDFINFASKSDELFIVKTHDVPPDARRVIYIARDGRASAVSYHHYLKDLTSARMSLQEVVVGSVLFGRWSRHVEGAVRRTSGETLFLRYEDLVENDEGVLQQVARFLNRPLQYKEREEFSKYKSVMPSFFRSGSNSANIDEIYDVCPNLFWIMNGTAMNVLGYYHKDFHANQTLAAIELAEGLGGSRGVH
ncbi:sulfotransferase domain-containing protein [soil metagenome]